MLSNFTLNKNFVIIKLNCSRRRSRGQISEILQNDVNKWRHKSKTGHDRENFFFQNIFLVTLNNFTLDKYFVIIKLTCSKRRSRGQIGEILQNDVNKWRHKSKTGHDMEKIFFPKCRSSLVKQLHPWSIFRKNHFKVLKIANMCQKVTFSCISYTKLPYKGPFSQKSLRSSVPTV